MVKITLLCLFISFQSYGQNANKYDSIIPKYLKVKPLLGSDNYIDDSIRTLVIDFLQANKLKPSEYFVDSFIRNESDSSYIHLYHLKGLKHLKELEIKNEKSEWQTNSVGNPGGSVILIYVRRENRIIGPFYSQ
jgi:hypothetical protein